MSELIERFEKYLYERSVSRGLCRNIHMMNGAELNEEDLREAITALQDKDKQIAELKGSLERIGSSETMTLPFMINKKTNEGKELDARLEFARQSIKEKE